MSQTQHTANRQAENGAAVTAPPAVVQTVVRVPRNLKWSLREIAARRQTTVERLAVTIFEEFVAREKGAAA